MSSTASTCEDPIDGEIEKKDECPAQQPSDQEVLTEQKKEVEKEEPESSRDAPKLQVKPKSPMVVHNDLQEEDAQSKAELAISSVCEKPIVGTDEKRDDCSTQQPPTEETPTEQKNADDEKEPEPSEDAPKLEGDYQPRPESKPMTLQEHQEAMIASGYTESSILITHPKPLTREFIQMRNKWLAEAEATTRAQLEITVRSPAAESYSSAPVVESPTTSPSPSPEASTDGVPLPTTAPVAPPVPAAPPAPAPEQEDQIEPKKAKIDE